MSSDWLGVPGVTALASVTASRSYPAGSANCDWWCGPAWEHIDRHPSAVAERPGPGASVADAVSSLEVLRAVRDGLVDRDLQFGDLGPWMLGTREVSWSVTVLIVHGLVRLRVFGFGPPQITARGLRMLERWTDLCVVGDQ